MGGTTVAADDQAGYSVLMGRPMRVGERVKRPACATPCPRVDLYAENEPAAEVLRLSLSEHTRALLAVPEVIALIGEGLEPRERGLIALRAGRALQDSRVMARLYPRTDEDA
jgi:hypothetical protein